MSANHQIKRQKCQFCNKRVFKLLLLLLSLIFILAIFYCHHLLTLNQLRTSTNSPSIIEGGSLPRFTNPNVMNKLNLKPSGSMIKIKCPAKGDPEPKWTWTKDGQKIERNLGTVTYNKMGITLEDLVPADNGNYTCNVCNIFGCISFTTKLEVNGKNFKILLNFYYFMF